MLSEGCWVADEDEEVLSDVPAAGATDDVAAGGCAVTCAFMVRVFSPCGSAFDMKVSVRFTGGLVAGNAGRG